MKFDGPDGVPQIIERGTARPCRSPCTQQSLNDLKKEIPTPERRFQKSLFMQWLIRCVTDQIQNEIDNLPAGKYCTSGVGIGF